MVKKVSASLRSYNDIKPVLKFCNRYSDKEKATLRINKRQQIRQYLRKLLCNTGVLGRSSTNEWWNKLQIINLDKKDLLAMNNAIRFLSCQDKIRDFFFVCVCLCVWLKECGMDSWWEADGESHEIWAHIIGISYISKANLIADAVTKPLPPSYLVGWNI